MPFPWIQTLEELESIYDRKPPPGVLRKAIDRLNDGYRAMVDLSTFAVLTTSGPRGLHLSACGGQPGYAYVADERTVLIPDWAVSNFRNDVAPNVVADARFGAVFMVPISGETLRVQGTATISVDPAHLRAVKSSKHPPRSVLALHVESAFFHCSKSLKSAGVWGRADPSPQVSAAIESLASSSGFPSVAQQADDSIVRSVARFDGLYKGAARSPFSVEYDHLPSAMCAMVAASPLVFFGSAGRTTLDASPRGGPRGFVAIADERTLLIPDWPGNNRVDSLRNLIHDQRAGALFFVPGLESTLRVSGTAGISADPGLTGRFGSEGSTPRAVIVLRLQRASLTLARPLVTSRLWGEFDEPPGTREMRKTMAAFWNSIKRRPDDPPDDVNPGARPGTSP